MIKISNAVLGAGAKAVEDRINQPGQCSYHDIARAAFVAMVEAWEGAKACEEDDLGPACLIPPLMEKRDDKA